MSTLGGKFHETGLDGSGDVYPGEKPEDNDIEPISIKETEARPTGSHL